MNFSRCAIEKRLWIKSSQEIISAHGSKKAIFTLVSLQDNVVVKGHWPQTSMNNFIDFAEYYKTFWINLQQPIKL